MKFKFFLLSSSWNERQSFLGFVPQGDACSPKKMVVLFKGCAFAPLNNGCLEQMHVLLKEMVVFFRRCMCSHVLLKKMNGIFKRCMCSQGKMIVFLRRCLCSSRKCLCFSRRCLYSPRKQLCFLKRHVCSQGK